MARQVIQSPEDWALDQFGACEFGDARRTRRAVRLAAQMASRPAASIPGQTENWSGAKAGYRLFKQEQVTFEATAQPHWEQVRQAARSRDVVLMIQDTSELDFSSHPHAEGLGPIGNGRGRGFMLHGTLAVDPRGSGEILGLGYQMLFCREEKSARRKKRKPETRTQRKLRKRESQIWPTSVRQVGRPGQTSRWVHVCDRYGDNYELFTACKTTGVDFVIRLAQDRRASLGHGSQAATGNLLRLVRGLRAVGETTLRVRSRPKRRAREAKLLVAYSKVTIFRPWLDRSAPEQLEAWVVRVWEADTPDGEEPVEWVLLTSVPVGSAGEGLEISPAGEGLEISRWYSLRWLIEEYHKCLKSGCKVEDRQLHEASRLAPCVGILGVVAVRLPQLKLSARQEPDRPAKTPPSEVWHAANPCGSLIRNGGSLPRA